MKKGLLFLVAIVAVTFASCTKDFTCTCTDSGVTYKYMLKESKKKAADALCTGKGIGTITDEDGTAWPEGTATCTLD